MQSLLYFFLIIEVNIGGGLSGSENLTLTIVLVT